MDTTVTSWDRRSLTSEQIENHFSHFYLLCALKKDEPNQPSINSNVFASGCYKHANEYWFYLIDTRQVLHVLNNEPRFLSITPDTGLIDLHTIHNNGSSSSVLPPSLIESYQPVHTFIEHYIQQLQEQTPDRVIDTRYVAVPLVTAVYFNPSSHVPSPILYHLHDGTEITNYPDSLAKWANVNSSDRTALYDAGCTTIPTTTNTTCTDEMKEAAQLTEKRFWYGIRIAIRQAELQRLLKEQFWQNVVHPKTFWKNILYNIPKIFNKNDNGSSNTADTLPRQTGIPYFQCRRTTRFGAGPNTVRVNVPFTFSQIINLLSDMDNTIDITKKCIVSTFSTNTKTEIRETSGSTKTEL